MPTSVVSSSRSHLDRGGSTMLVGRQPILDRRGNTFGYELLFRSTADDLAAAITDGAVASAQVITRAFTDIGLDDVVGSKLAFVNIPAHYLVHPALVEGLPSDRVVLEILGDIVPTDDVLAGMRHLRSLGYTFAIDDFTPSVPAAPLRQYASIVKYDHRDIDIDINAMRRAIESDHRAGRQVVIERVETPEDRIKAGELGADYFQGFHFARGTSGSTVEIPANIVALVRMTAELNRPDATTGEIVDLLTQDVALSIKILRVVNSVAGGAARRVESIHQAAVLIGRNRLRAWAALTMLSSIDGRPPELVSLALTRSKFCELAAISEHRSNPETYFTVGMLSLLEPMTGAPIDVMVHELDLDPAIDDALLDGAGPLGATLALAVRMELGDHDHDDSPAAEIFRLHREAVAWSTQITNVTQ